MANYIAYASALVNSLLTSGIIFGWPSLVILLKKEGIYREGCGSSIVTNATTAVDICADQEVKLNLIFTVGFFGLIGSRLALGILLDRCGKTVTNVTASSTTPTCCSVAHIASAQARSFVAP